MDKVRFVGPMAPATKRRRPSSREVLACGGGPPEWELPEVREDVSDGAPREADAARAPESAC